jgi:hypothetical protein
MTSLANRAIFLRSGRPCTGARSMPDAAMLILLVLAVVFPAAYARFCDRV